MNPEVQTDYDNQATVNKEICNILAKAIDNVLPEAECIIWHS
jgi:hypothetical protein